MREIPFAIIQFPLYEYFKTLYQRILKNNSSLESYEVAMCGAMAGTKLNQFKFMNLC